jgi:hypothetical protein
MRVVYKICHTFIVLALSARQCPSELTAQQHPLDRQLCVYELAI